MTWRYEKPMKGTNFYPHHRRWSCARWILEALRSLHEPVEIGRAWYFLGRADADNSVMFDCNDPLASAYNRRIQTVMALLCAAETQRIEELEFYLSLIHI